MPFWSSKRLLVSVLFPLLILANVAFAQTDKTSQSKAKAPQPCQQKAFDEAGEDRFRQNLLKAMMALTQSAYRRFQAEVQLAPKTAFVDPNDPLGGPDAVRGSTLLDLHEQGTIWLSLLLSSHDPSLQQFQNEVTSGLKTDPTLGVKQLRKQVRKYDVDKKASAQPATALIVQTENEFSTLVSDMDSTVPKKSVSKDCYDYIVAKYKGYLEAQLPRVIDVSKPGIPTTFLFLSPRFGTSTPLEKDTHYQRTAEEAKQKHVITRDVRFQGIYVVRVTPLDSKGLRFHLAGFWLYLKINDPELYVPRDPLHSISSTGAWDLHHMPPAELSDEGLVSPAAEWMEIEVRNGRLVIAKGRATFLQRRATPIDLTVTPIDRLQPAEGELNAKLPGFPLSSQQQELLWTQLESSVSSQRRMGQGRMFVDQMPPIPGRFQFPDTAEGEEAYQKARAKAVSPLPDKSSLAHVRVPQASGASVPQQAAPPSNATLSPPTPPEPSVNPSEVHFQFGDMPAAGEAWLKGPYTAPGNIQQERLELALYWVSRFLQDAKDRNTQSEALQLLLERIPKSVFCVNTQSVHLPHPVPGGVVLAGMKNSFDASLPDVAADLLGADESLVYQFNSGQPNAQGERAEVARLASQYFASQPLDPNAPDPFLVAARAPQPTADQWKLVTIARVWDYPNPYRFFGPQKNDADDSAPPSPLDEDTVARLKEEKAIVTELSLDGIFNKDKQGNYRNDQGALSPLGLLFQLALREPSGLLLLGRAEENERVLAANALRRGDASLAASHLAKANEIAGTLDIVKSLRTAAPDAYLDLYLTKAPTEKRATSKSALQVPSTAHDAAPWRARWMQSKDRWTLIAGVRQNDIPINPKAIEYLAESLNEKLPAGTSVLPALVLLKESVQHSSNPQYGTYALMFEEMDHRTPPAVAESIAPNGR